MGAGTGDGSDSSPGVKPGASTALLAEVAATTEHREAEPPSLLPGTVVGRFETLREPGRGGFGDLLAELKRRHVFRVMVGYGIFAFAALQVAEPLMHGLHLPDWVLTAVIAALAVGFPAALILAWVFDLTARGVRRTPSVAGPGAISFSRRRLAALLVVVALVGALPGVGWYAWKRASDHRPVSATPEAAPSIAVLPFVNMSGDPENEYFSDGLSEEILNALAQMPGLRVPARTSSFAFKGKPENVKKIAEALQVATLLEGSVRKVGGRVRITAQLVNAADGYHLWSQTFDRELKDIFAIQDEIAAAIAEAMKLRLAPAAFSGSKKPGATSNPEAYEAYLKGRQALNERTKVSIQKALVHFQKAVALDPGFAAAHADAAVAMLMLGKSGNTYGDMPLPEALARARSFLEKAMALAPDIPKVLGAAGLLEEYALHPERSLELYERALALSPNDGDVQNWRRLVLLDLGRYDQLLAAAAEAVRSDPLSKNNLLQQVLGLYFFGHEAESGPVVERLRSLDETWGHVALGRVAVKRGDKAGAVRHLVPALQEGRETEIPFLVDALASLGLREEALGVARGEHAYVYLALGDFPAALKLARAAARKAPDDPEVQVDLFLALYRTGLFGEAAPLAALRHQASHGTGLDPGVLLLMADAARSAGRAAEADGYREQAGGLVDRMRHGGVSSRIVDIRRLLLAAYDRRDDEAVALIAGLLPAPPIGRAELELPIFSRLLLRPDYQGVLKRVDAALAVQRAQVIDMLCGPQRLSPTWQPAPETCAGGAPPR